MPPRKMKYVFNISSWLLQFKFRWKHVLNSLRRTPAEFSARVIARPRITIRISVKTDSLLDNLFPTNYARPEKHLYNLLDSSRLK